MELDVGSEGGGGDEDVWVAQDGFRFLADEVEEFVVAQVCRRSARIYGAQEGGRG